MATYYILPQSRGLNKYLPKVNLINGNLSLNQLEMINKGSR